ncbi:cytochrome C5 [Microbacterium sp. NPDC087665]|uniref:cytochrome C5 n=1 Tax=Microbacterium sp. NPDC087665 TaxID=3364194 RepID=UPI0038146D57
MTSALEELRDRISASGLLDEPAAADGIVFGRAHLESAGVDVMVNVDPEIQDDDEPDFDIDPLIEGVQRILSVNETRWRAIVDETATDIEEAVGESEVRERIDLRDDLEATSLVVFADATLVALVAPRQFPDSRILVQLDEDFEISGVEVVAKDGAEAAEFDSLDDLLDDITGGDFRSTDDD